jgi:hypothetical protein
MPTSDENVYDKAERYAIKRLDPTGFLRWLLPGLDADLGFSRWLETQAAPFPGEPDRRCDCVAELSSRSDSQPPWACLVEPQGQWQSYFLTRVWQYVLTLHDELRHGPHGTDRYLMTAAVVDLCERPLPEVLSWVPPGTTGMGLTCRVGMRHVYQEAAERTLEAVAAGTVARCVMVWVPLMDGGDQAEVARRWREIADGEPDVRVRGTYGLLAVTLAEKRGRRELWAKALEGLTMTNSPFVNELLEKAKLEIARDAETKGRTEEVRSLLLDTLEARFKATPSPDVARAVAAKDSLDELRQWQRHAATCDSLDDFRQKVGLAAGS